MTSLDTALPQLAAIVLAAGAGKRAGGFKPLWPLGDGLVIDAVIEAARSVCDVVRVVGGAEIARLEHHLARTHPDVELVRNEGWQRGAYAQRQQQLHRRHHDERRNVEGHHSRCPRQLQRRLESHGQ